MSSAQKTNIDRIEQIIDAMMEVAGGDYNTQVKLSGRNDHIDALAMGFNTMVDDLKASKRIRQENEEIKRINSELKIAKKKAEESNKLKSAFIANLSHEIRTPMNGVIGFAAMLLDDKISHDKRQNFVQIIINSSSQLLQIIDDILEISKLGTGQIRTVK